MTGAPGWTRLTVDWAQAKEVLGELLDAPPESRRAVLHARCGADESLRSAVERMLAVHGDESGFLEAPGAEVSSRSGLQPPPTLIGERIGPYEIIGLLGEGGFGVVYRARQRQPIERDVALKILRPGLDVRPVLERFESERAILARLDHPAIAGVLDAGAAPDGRPFVVMELIRGRSILEECKAREVDLRSRVALLSRTCRAIHHAHQRAIIHRDIKPSNILVTEVDGALEPRVIDFGIARAIEGGDESDRTRVGDRIGTPRYMSPEQIRGTGSADIRVDVYALGVVLCELLTGSVPRRDETDSGSGDRSTVTRPSRLVLSDPGNALAADARIRLSRSLRGDLDRIVLRAVAWEPAERYDSAAALADDLDRYLRGEPVLAAPPSVAYRVRKLVLRHRLASTLALLAVLALTIGAVVAIAGWREALVARRAADREAARAEFVRRFFLMDMLAAASPAATREQELTVAELLEEAERAAPLRLSAAPDVLRDVYGQLGAAYYRLSRAEDSIRVLARAIELTSTLEGPDSDAALRLRIEHAGAMFSVPGRHEEAGELRRRNLADALRLVGENHPTALRARLASASDMEDPAAVRAEVESLYREIERQGIEEPELVVGVLRALGAIYALSEDAEAAIGVARRMVALTEGQFGRLHSHTISSRRRLGEILCESGSTKEGLDVVDEALADARAFYPRGHGSLKGLLQIAVNVNGKYGRPQRGLELADEVVAIQRELGDPSGIPLDAALSLRGAVLVRLGRFQEARTALEEVLPRRIAQWGEGSGQVGSDMRALGEACMELGDLDGALQWAQRALAHQKPGSPGYVGSAIIDARVRAERGDRRGALERLRAVQSMEMSGEWRRTLEGVIAELSREQP